MMPHATRRTRVWIAALLPAITCAAAAPSSAQPAVTVGAGSYAAFPPPHEGDGPAGMVNAPTLYLTEEAPRPIPTNDWWTDLINNTFSGALWAFPLRIDATGSGVDVFFPTRWNESGNDPVSEAPLRLGAAGFTAADARAHAWGDWTLTFRSAAAASDRRIDFTIGRGLPFVWAEYAPGLSPRLDLPGEASFIDDRGQPIKLPATADHLAIRCGPRLYGVFLPPKTRVTQQGDALEFSFTASDRYVVLSPLARPTDLPLFAQHAYAIPRDSRFTWDYEPEAGTVTTRFELKTQPLRADKSDQLIQGFLPHHFRDTRHDIDFIESTYFTPRGTMRCAVGNTFAYTYHFPGLLPNFPAPGSLNANPASPGDPPAGSRVANDAFDKARMADYLARYTTRAGEYGGDTYWGGKDLVRLAKYMDLAYQLNDPNADAMRDALRVALTDWLTYDPEETEHYFARYDNWGALIGFNESYWSYQFTDNHFHYGYFTLAAALLEMRDPGFLDDDRFGPMLRLIAGQYANWDRDDAAFPYLRTFDPWAGHSYAGGLSSPGGNNQESTSEAIQSWAGLFLLGTMLDDRDMRACGAMGLAVESRATLEYWFDIHGDTFGNQYDHPIVGILFNGGRAYATYFSGDPAWIHGIQWLPIHPALDFLTHDRDWARDIFNNMLAERKKTEGDDSISSMGAALGNVILGYQLLFDPDAVVKQMDELWDADDPVARDNYTGGLTYAYAHTLSELGLRDPTVHFSQPTAASYVRDTRHGPKSTYVLYNPNPYPQLITAYRQDKPLGHALVPARAFTTTDQLQPISSGQDRGLLATLPAADEIAVSRRIDTIYAVFAEPLDPDTLSQIRLEGPDAPRVTASLRGKHNVVELGLNGRLRPDTTYTVTVSPGLLHADGRAAIAEEHRWAFTLEPLPPLGIESSKPAAGAQRVALDLSDIEVEFNIPVSRDVLRRVRLTGPGKIQLTPRVDAGLPERAVFEISGPLEPDAAYTVELPGDAWATPPAELPSILFSTEPPPCPPNIYQDSFAGRGYSADGGLTADFADADAPHAGKFAIKLTAGDTDGSLYLFRGRSDHGDGRDPADLSAYDRLTFFMKTDADEVWLKIGHPVFDQAFMQTRYTDVSPRYRQVSLDLPENPDQINTLLVVSVPAKKTVSLDEIRLHKPGE